MAQLTQEQWDGLVSVNGEDWARDFASRNGDTAPGEDPEDASDTPMSAAPTGLGSGLGVKQLETDIIAQQQQEAAMRKKRFEEAAATLAEQRSGPPLSERLMALSASFFQPKQFSGFSGTMANLMPTLARESAAVRQGKITDADKLRALQEKYEDANMAGMGKALENRIKLAKLRDDQIKAGRPSYQLNPVTGQLQGVPKQIHQPTSREEYDAIPRGEYYMVPDGPKKGQIVPKVT